MGTSGQGSVRRPRWPGEPGCFQMCVWVWVRQDTYFSAPTSEEGSLWGTPPTGPAALRTPESPSHECKTESNPATAGQVPFPAAGRAEPGPTRFLLLSPLRRGPPSLSSRWLRGTPAQPVGPQWAAPGGPWPSPGLTRDPRAGGGAESRSLPPSLSGRDSASGPLPCAPARGGKCEAPLRAQAKPNSPPPQTLSHWRVRGAVGRRG